MVAGRFVNRYCSSGRDDSHAKRWEHRDEPVGKYDEIRSDRNLLMAIVRIFTLWREHFALALRSASEFAVLITGLVR